MQNGVRFDQITSLAYGPRTSRYWPKLNGCLFATVQSTSNFEVQSLYYGVSSTKQSAISRYPWTSDLAKEPLVKPFRSRKGHSSDNRSGAFELN